MNGCRGLVLVVGLFVLMQGLGVSQAYHDEAYLVGGFQGNVPGSGIFVVRGDGSSSLVALTWSPSYGFRMDSDNRHVVVGVSYNSTVPAGPQYPRHGIYRYHPSTRTFTTIYGPDQRNCQIVGAVHVDGNGDYVFVGHGASVPSRLMKVTPGGAITTLFSSSSMAIVSPVGRDIMTGNLLVGAQPLGGNLCGLIEIGSGGAVTTFTYANSGRYCWSYGGHSGNLPQQHSTGDIFGPHGTMLRAVRGGPTTQVGLVNDGRTSPSQTPAHTGFYAYEYDNQTAPQERWVGFNHSFSSKFGFRQWIGYVDKNFVYTSIHVPAPTLIYDWDFDFYRGRHIQTVRTATQRWQVRISCPRFAGLGYAVAASVSGVRPAIPVRDGRRINIVPDTLFQLTLANRLPGIWSPGPGILDANGDAQAALDLSAIPKPPALRIPVWIAVVILDPQAPSGIAYIPDTWVMQV